MFFEEIIKDGNSMPSRWSMAEFSIGTKFNKKMRRIFYRCMAKRSTCH